jgi:hypothetical protein
MAKNRDSGESLISSIFQSIEQPTNNVPASKEINVIKEQIESNEIVKKEDEKPEDNNKQKRVVNPSSKDKKSADDDKRAEAQINEKLILPKVLSQVEERKTVRKQFLFTPSEAKWLKEISQKKGMSENQLIEKLIELAKKSN